VLKIEGSEIHSTVYSIPVVFRRAKLFSDTKKVFTQRYVVQSSKNVSQIPAYTVENILHIVCTVQCTVYNG
jgi:hypothetical protein